MIGPEVVGQCLVQLDLLSQSGGVLWEPPQVFIQGRRLPQSLAEQKFAVDQLQGFFEVERQGRVHREVVLGRHSLSRLPARRLIGAQHGHDLSQTEAPSAGQEVAEVGLLPLPP